MKNIFLFSFENSTPGRMLMADFVIMALIFIIMVTGTMSSLISQHCSRRQTAENRSNNSALFDTAVNIDNIFEKVSRSPSMSRTPTTH